MGQAVRHPVGQNRGGRARFDDAVQRIAPLLDEEPTGKTAAFFSITSNNLATVRKGGDYVAKMIGWRAAATSLPT